MYRYRSTEFPDYLDPAPIKITAILDVYIYKRKAIVFRSERVMFGFREFVAVGKSTDDIAELEAAGSMYCLLFPLDDRVKNGVMDLSGGLKHVQDWGYVLGPSGQALSLDPA